MCHIAENPLPIRYQLKIWYQSLGFFSSLPRLPLLLPSLSRHLTASQVYKLNRAIIQFRYNDTLSDLIINLHRIE